MSMWRLTATVLVLLAGTALAVAAYLDTQRGTVAQDLGTILELGPVGPMPRPVRVPETARDRNHPRIGAFSARPIPAAARQRVDEALDVAPLVRAALEDCEPVPAASAWIPEDLPAEPVN